MSIPRNVRYAAKLAYQLCVMRGKDESIQLDMHCQVINPDVWVTTDGGGRPECYCVPIAKSWINL